MNSLEGRFYEFDEFRIDLKQQCLFRNGEIVESVTPLLFLLLVEFAHNNGEILNKEALSRAWKESVVDEQKITRAISRLRSALGETTCGKSYIESIPRRGYRFSVNITPVVSQAESVSSQNGHAQLEADVVGASRRRTSLQPATPAIPGLALSTHSQHFTNTRLAHKVLAGTALLLLGLTIGVALYFSSPEKLPNNQASDNRVIAVLPLKPLNLSSDDAYLAIGLTDLLIARLSHFPQLHVRSIGAARRSANLEDPVQVGKDLNVQFVLDGNIQKDEKQIRVTLNLIETATGNTVWSDSIDERFTGVLALQDALSQRVKDAIAFHLHNESALVINRSTNSEAAYDEYLRGRYFLSERNEKSLAKAIQAFQRAIAADPNFALAYVGLANTYLLLGSAGYSSWSPEAVVPKAKAVLEQAQDLDNSLAEIYATSGYIKWFYEWDWAGAELDYLQALKRSPNDATTHQYYGLCLMTLGRLDEALEQMRLARDAEPRSLIFNMWVAHIYYYKRDYDRALEHYLKLLDMDEKFYPAHLAIGSTYAQKGMFEQAQAEFRIAQKLYNSPLIPAVSGYAYAVAGDKQGAQKRLTELQNLSTQQAISPYFYAVIYAGLDNKVKVFELLEKTCAEHSGHLSDIKVDPTFDALRLDERFTHILRRMNL